MRSLLIVLIMASCLYGCSTEDDNLLEYYPKSGAWIYKRNNKSMHIDFFKSPLTNIFITTDSLIEFKKLGPGEVGYIERSQYPLKKDKTGFMFAYRELNDDSVLLKKYFIEGKYLCVSVIEDYVTLDIHKPYSTDNRTVAFIGGARSDIKGFSLEEGLAYRDRKMNPEVSGYFYIDDNIKEVKASSYLEETSSGNAFSYSAAMMLDRFCYDGYEGPSFIEFDFFKRCWSEGVDGYGIGEYLDVIFDRPVDVLTVLNGYVDFFKMNLYKDNSRLLKIKIESEDPLFNLEYVFDDEVKFHDIDLPQKTAALRLTISDVFPGDKYQDTCISALLGFEKYEIEDEKREVIKYLKKLGLL